MSAEIDAACPVETRKDIAGKLDQSERAAASKLWESCQDAIVEKSPQYKSLREDIEAFNQAQKPDIMGDLKAHSQLQRRIDKLLEDQFPKAVEAMNLITGLQQSDNKCRIVEIQWEQPGKHGGPMQGMKALKVSCETGHTSILKGTVPGDDSGYNPPHKPEEKPNLKPAIGSFTGPGV